MINSGYPGCSYVRILLPAMHNGFSCDKQSPLELQKAYTKGNIDTERIKNELTWANIVVFHRPENQEFHKLADALQRNGKKVVMDNDDTFKLDDYHPLANFSEEAYEKNLKRRSSAIDSFVKKADMVTTTTEFLAKEYRKLNKNVIVLPNCIDPIDWDKPLRNEGNKVRIGIVGSAAIEYDYLHVKNVLKELSDREDVELIMFGLGDKEHRKNNPKVTKVFQEEYDFWDSLNIEHFPWCPIHEYQSKLNEARLDMMIVPRKDNYFNRCKSNIKFLEAAMCEIPVIVQSFKDGPYEELIGKEMGILIKDNKDWMKQIDTLIDDKKLRCEMGRNAKEYTLKYYNIENNYLKWAEAYDKISNRE